MKLLVASAVFVVTTVAAHTALASCRIHNDTGWDFKVESGNTSNQSVSSHSTTSIASGKIKGKDEKTGKTISGSCKDGDTLIIKDEGGIPVLSLK